MQSKLSLKASLESQVESKLALESGWSGDQGPKTAAGEAHVGSTWQVLVPTWWFLDGCGQFLVELLGWFVGWLVCWLVVACLGN